MRMFKYSMPDGQIGVCTIGDRELIEKEVRRYKKLDRPLTDEEFDKHVEFVSLPRGVDKLPLEGVEKKRFIDSSELPKDRTFRPAWVDDGEKISVDMPKARKLHLERLRAKRDLMLKNLDGEYMKALESGNKVKSEEIAAKKQKLRDMPVDSRAELDALEDPDELKNYEPDVLKDKPVVRDEQPN